MMENAILVFTARGLSTLLKEGGSQAWVLNPKRARKCAYLVCTQNEHKKEAWCSPEAPHGSAFLVGKIKSIEVSPESDDKQKWLIRILEYATLQKPSVWDGGRNPVRYVSLSDIGIDPSELEFKPMPDISQSTPAATVHSTQAISIEEAKKALAAFYKIGQENIEITIRS